MESTVSLSHRVNIIPLSQVSLRSIVTAIDLRPNGCVLMVLDDGTGSINVCCWDNSCDSSDYVTNERGIAKRFSCNVGDLCKIMGKIIALTAGTKQHHTLVDDEGQCNKCICKP